MIYHNPEVKEKLEEFGIPVLVEHSSYESHPLGPDRMGEALRCTAGQRRRGRGTFLRSRQRS